MSASHDWQLCDAAGSPLAELTTASGKTIAYKRKPYIEAQFTVSHEDELATYLLGAVANTGMPTLRCYRRGLNDTAGILRFRGACVSIDEQAGETSLLTATFRSPFSQLLGNGSDQGRFISSAVSYTATDAGTIAKNLVDLANTDGATGLGTDPTLIAATKTRDRTYPIGTNIGQAVIDLTNVLDGFDFYETWIDGVTSTIAMFNVVASQGVDKPNAVFQYGPGTVANVSDVQRATLPPVNWVLVIGGNGLTSTYKDTTSIGKYGVNQGKAEFTDVIEQATLDDKARGLCRPSPVKTITWTPEYLMDACPQPFDDFNLGDTVRFFASRGALSESTSVRVNGFTVVVDDNGFESAQIQDPTLPEDEAVLRASLAVEVTQ